MYIVCSVWNDSWCWFLYECRITLLHHWGLQSWIYKPRYLSVFQALLVRMRVNVNLVNAFTWMLLSMPVFIFTFFPVFFALFNAFLRYKSSLAITWKFYRWLICDAYWINNIQSTLWMVSKCAVSFYPCRLRAHLVEHRPLYKHLQVR